MGLFTNLRQYLLNLLEIVNTYSGIYHFTFSDRLIYLKFGENPGSLKNFPSFKIIGADNSFFQLKICDFSFFWPKIFNNNGISYMYQEIFEPAKNNPHAYELENHKIKKGDIVIDAGACEGFFTYLMINRGAKVIAIEPVNILAEALEKTFHDEIKIGRVSIFKGALSDYTGYGHLISDSKQIFESHLNEIGEEVRVFKLDDLIKSKVDFIKMDIEGGEVNALFGAKEIIQNYKPKLSIAVYHEYENARIIMDFLKEICPEYTISHRGIFAYNRVKPRPMMVYAW